MAVEQPRRPPADPASFELEYAAADTLAKRELPSRETIEQYVHLSVLFRDERIVVGGPQDDGHLDVFVRFRLGGPDGWQPLAPCSDFRSAAAGWRAFDEWAQGDVNVLGYSDGTLAIETLGVPSALIPEAERQARQNVDAVSRGLR